MALHKVELVYPVLQKNENRNHNDNTISELDLLVVKAARVSYGQTTKTPTEDKNLIKYLYRHGHMSPFEHVVFSFTIEAPIFILRQLMRYRTCSFNEQSARYKKVEFNFIDYTPAYFNIDKEVNNDALNNLCEKYNNLVKNSYVLYKEALTLGISKEQARGILPQCMKSKIVMTVNLRNLFHIFNQRISADAQCECKQLVEDILLLIKDYVPACYEAYSQYEKNKLIFYEKELNSLTKPNFSDASRTEEVEYLQKKIKLLQHLSPSKLNNNILNEERI